jgi:hypothetical protein
MCPVHRVGAVDAFIMPQHGMRCRMGPCSSTVLPRA